MERLYVNVRFLFSTFFILLKTKVETMAIVSISRYQYIFMILMLNFMLIDKILSWTCLKLNNK